MQVPDSLQNGWQNVLNTDMKKLAWFVKLQMKQQNDLDDAWEIRPGWTYCKENLTVVIGNKHQIQYMVMLTKRYCNMAGDAGITDSSA